MQKVILSKICENLLYIEADNHTKNSIRKHFSYLKERVSI
jgi:hypothetical protein